MADNTKDVVVIKTGTEVLFDCEESGQRRFNEEAARAVLSQCVALQKRYRVIAVVSGLQAMLAEEGVERRDWSHTEQQGQLRFFRKLDGLVEKEVMGFHQGLLDIGERSGIDDWMGGIRQCIEDDRHLAILNELHLPDPEETTPVADRDRFVGNDDLALLTAILFGARHMVLATCVDGFLDQGQNVIPQLDANTSFSNWKQYLQQETSAGGTGGMLTKIQAAYIAAHFGCSSHILHGRAQNAIQNAIAGSDDVLQTHIPSVREEQANPNRIVSLIHRRRQEWIQELLQKYSTSV